ncbi:MAG: sialidase [Myxococcales bacterium]|nr:sialidase [Myxococcales bacterium]
MRNVFVVAILMSLATVSHAATVEELLAKNLAARGGEAKLRELRTLRLTGRIVFGGGGFSIDATWAQVQERPGLIRSEVTLQGLTQITAYDGREGWSLSPFSGRRDPEKSSEDDARALAQQAELDGPLVGWRDKGHRIESLGTEDVDGTPAIKLRVTRKDGDVQYVYLDPDSFLEIRITTVRKVRGTEDITETDLGGYQQVAGVWLPFAIESGTKGGPRNSRITVERAEINVPVDKAWFELPTPKKPAVALIVPVGRSESDPLHPGDAKPDTGVVTPVAKVERSTADVGTISGLGARNIGSAAMSGRIAAVAALASGGKTLLYVGAASGGVWKSLDGGTTFKPVFDKQPVQSIGAIAIDPSDSKTVWVGTGESWTRNSVSIGDGIYKSTDGGETWNNVGLPASERITKIIVHPKNGQIVYACVPGKLWSDSTDRGLYKTSDGGKSWSLVLKGGNASTGCSGLTMDPKHPDVLIAGLWDFRRKGWTFRSGGEGPNDPSGSGLHRSTDGGKTWTSMAANKGLPAGPWGRVEVVFAPSNENIVYALIESKSSALFRSADGGATWEQRDGSQMMVWRPFYFARLVVDPTNPDRIFKPDGNLIVSEDGGRSFSSAGGGAHGDWHDLWIEPTNPKHVIGGDDGGLWLSYDGGNRWWKGNNLPISQFYHVAIDNKDPYQVYGGLQDNSSWVGDSAYPGGITSSRWENLYNSDGFWVIPDPTDPNAVYAEGQGGYVGRIDRKSLAARDIQPKAGYHEKLRFNWNTPLHASPTQKGTIYIGSQFLFRSRDRGDNWERVSPDLTTNDPAKQKQELSGGVTVDNSSAEMHTTIYSISESPKNASVIWVGTDDGNVQLSRDGTKTWTNVAGNITGLPKSSWVSWVEASRFDAGTAYAAFDRHSFGDMTPWVYKTTDYGKSWVRIVSPEKGVRGFAHVVKEDSEKPNLLFVGTEFGLWISLDGGGTWAEFKGSNFPSVAVRDLQVQPRDGDLVIATHGRGIWIIDDLSPLRALTDATLQKSTAFLPTRAIQQRMPASGGWSEGDAGFTGDNPPDGVIVTYYLRTRHIFGPIKLEVLDGAGKLVDTVTPSKRRGINRVAWNMRVKPPRVPRAAQVAFSASQGPRVPPGTYTLRLTRGAEVVETKITIGLDRRAPYNAADRKAQFDAVMKAHALFGDMTKLTGRIEAAREAVRERLQKLPETDLLASKLRLMLDKIETAKKLIVATTEGGAITGEERIREHLDLVYGALQTWEGRPAKYQVDRIEVLRRELGDVEKTIEVIVTKDARAIDDELQKHKLTPIPVIGAVDRHERAGLDDAALRCLASHGKDCVDEDRAATRSERD